MEGPAIGREEKRVNWAIGRGRREESLVTYGPLPLNSSCINYSTPLLFPTPSSSSFFNYSSPPHGSYSFTSSFSPLLSYSSSPETLFSSSPLHSSIFSSALLFFATPLYSFPRSEHRTRMIILGKDWERQDWSGGGEEWRRRKSNIATHIVWPHFHLPVSITPHPSVYLFCTRWNATVGLMFVCLFLLYSQFTPQMCWFQSSLVFDTHTKTHTQSCKSMRVHNDYVCVHTY